jgi:hypothetical protein
MAISVVVDKWGHEIQIDTSRCLEDFGINFLDHTENMIVLGVGPHPITGQKTLWIGILGRKKINGMIVVEDSGLKPLEY